ncbi:MAG: VacJ family lipoprotein [Polaromonas sp.]|uniref:MlaA family lipoprotein n=1 Tax=Polaromonas sp. TaxID=1869339 RepID=UPI0032647EDD
MTTKIIIKKRAGWAGAVLALVLLQGCATGPSANPADPLEPFNRTMFNFNDSVDRAVVKPVATAYRDVTPALVRTGVTNFFGNISDVWSTVNNLLQGKGQAATESLFRVTTNTIWGVGGIFDVASDLKIPKHSEDFGQTLGVWGVGSGPYLVLPLLGPSSARDSVGSLVDYQGDLVSRIDHVSTRNSLTALRLVNARANVLGAGDVLDQAALDKYSFTREIYLQRRRSLIGGPSAEKEERYDLPEGASAAPANPASAAK